MVLVPKNYADVRCAANRKASSKKHWDCTHITFQNVVQLCLQIFRSCVCAFQSCMCL